MNRRGQLFLVGIMLAAVAFIMVVSLLEAMKDQASLARTNLNCSQTSLSAGEAGTCIVTDSYLFVWAGSALAVAIGVISMKKFGSGGA